MPGRPRELCAGAGRDGVTPPVGGSRVAGSPVERQRQLLDLIALWVEVMPQAAAERRLAEIEAELPILRFACTDRRIREHPLDRPVPSEGDGSASRQDDRKAIAGFLAALIDRIRFGA